MSAGWVWGTPARGNATPAFEATPSKEGMGRFPSLLLV